MDNRFVMESPKKCSLYSIINTEKIHIVFFLKKHFKEEFKFIKDCFKIHALKRQGLFKPALISMSMKNSVARENSSIKGIWKLFEEIYHTKILEFNKLKNNKKIS